MQAVSKATRAPGKYRLVWDGTDGDNKPVSQGTYTIRVEVHREYGRHVQQTGALKCMGDEVKLTLKETAETEATEVVYGPREK
jgi:hypothetical protein